MDLIYIQECEELDFENMSPRDIYKMVFEVGVYCGANEMTRMIQNGEIPEVVYTHKKD